jgi:hypothetical protein
VSNPYTVHVYLARIERLRGERAVAVDAVYAQVLDNLIVDTAQAMENDIQHWALLEVWSVIC